MARQIVFVPPHRYRAVLVCVYSAFVFPICTSQAWIELLMGIEREDVVFDSSSAKEKMTESE